MEILMSSLRSSGISLPTSISSIEDLTPDAIVSVCAQFLVLIDDSIPPFPTSLPLLATDRFKLCADLAAVIKSSGYRGDLSFNQFLYPSNEDLYKLVRFLVERLAESSEGRKSVHIEKCKPTSSNNEYSCDSPKVLNQLNKKDGEVGEDCSGKARPFSARSQVELKEESSVSSHNLVESVSSESRDKENSCNKETKELLSEELLNWNSKEASFNGENKFLTESEDKLASLQIGSSMVNDEVDNLQNQEKMLMVRKHARRLEVLKLENEHELLKAAADMAVDDQHSVDFYIGELNELVEEKRRNIMTLKSQWTALKQTLEERKETLGQSIHSLEPGVQEKLDQLKEIERETESTISKIQKQVVEHAKLLEELERLPTLPPRKSYIQRITEVTKSSKKQDADINRILKETRELQLESNTVQERLARTHAVVDETVFREAKKDAVGRQVYRLLTSIHDSFEQISEKILTTDRARREAADLEVKLAVLSSRSFDINKLQSDLDSIRKENDLLEQQVHCDSLQ